MKSNFIKELPPQQKFFLLLLGIGGATVTYFSVKKIMKNAKAKKLQKKLFERYQESITINDQGTAQQVNFSIKAGVIYDSFYNNDVFGFTENEDRAIETLLSIPKQYVKTLAKYYFDLYGKILQNDYIKFCRESQYQKIKHYFE